MLWFTYESIIPSNFKWYHRIASRPLYHSLGPNEVLSEILLGSSPEIMKGKVSAANYEVLIMELDYLNKSSNG